MISISLQPEHDTPEIMSAYAKTYGIGPGWLLLTGKPAYRTSASPAGFRRFDPAVDANLDEHLGTVRISNERARRWAMSPRCSHPRHWSVPGPGDPRFT